MVDVFDEVHVQINDVHSCATESIHIHSAGRTIRARQLKLFDMMCALTLVHKRICMGVVLVVSGLSTGMYLPVAGIGLYDR